MRAATGHGPPVMPAAAMTRSTFPMLRRTVVAVLLAGLLLVPLAVVLLAVQTEPRIADPGPPDALAAAHTRDLAERLHTFIATNGAGASFSVDEDQLNAVLASAQRLSPGLFGLAHIGADEVTVEISAGAPLLPRGLWANLHLGLMSSEQGLRLTSARLGRLPLPPGLVQRAATMALDRLLGKDLGTVAVDSVAAVRVTPPQVTLAFDFGDDPGAFFDRLRERAVSAAGTTARERVYDQLWFIDRKVRSGELPWSGSMLPFVQQAIGLAAGQTEGDPREELRAAFYALALYCGDPEFGQVISMELKSYMRGARNGCDTTTLAGRDDLKRHFLISAGLYAASSGRASFGMGELKELLDSNTGGTGFSFDDVAADLAGIRFATAFLDAPRAEWPAMLARIDGEADILPEVHDLPSGLTEDEFRRRFRDVDSPAYAAMVAAIRGRIDALPLYAGRPID